MKKLYTFLLGAALACMPAAAAHRSVLSDYAKQQPSNVSTRLTNITKTATAAAKVAAKADAADDIKWGEWQSYGQGTITFDDMFELFTGIEGYSGDFTGKTVDVRYAEKPALKEQYRFNDIFNHVDIIVDVDPVSGQIDIQPQTTGIDDWGEDFIVADFANCYRLYSSPEDLDLTEEEFQEVIDKYASYNYYIPELKRFYVFVGYYLESLDDVVAMSDILFQLDGADNYAPALTPASVFVNENAKVNLDFPAEASYIRYATLPGVYNEKKLQQLIDGNIGTKHTEAGELSLDKANLADGLNTFMAITYSAKNDRALESSHCEFTVLNHDTDSWTSLGLTDVTGDILEMIYETEPATYKVEIQQNNADNKLFRLVNAHGATHPLNSSADDYDNTNDHYLVFDTTDPDNVLLTPAHIEKNMAAPAFVAGTAAVMLEQGASENQARPYRGKLADGAITFPTNGLIMGSAKWSAFDPEVADDTLLYTNLNGAFKVKIPTSGIESISTDSNATAQYFNLQGMPVNEPAAGTIVIERRGNNVRKLIVH